MFKWSEAGTDFFVQEIFTEKKVDSRTENDIICGLGNAECSQKAWFNFTMI